MGKDFEIVMEKVPSTIIDKKGNWSCNTDNYKCFLENKNGDILSYEYQCMLDLGNDHFAVCNVVSDINYFMGSNSADDRYYDIIHREYKVNNSKLKWGIIRINRTVQGMIIPNGETVIIPCLYDRISSNNLQTATAYHNGKLTYLDIDINSENYGKQLVPCILEHAVPFSTQYDGFAECSINDKTGYLPRNCKAKEYIEGDELLRGKQAWLISKYLKTKDIDLSDEIVSSYFNLTGIKLPKEKGLVLTKNKKNW